MKEEQYTQYEKEILIGVFGYNKEQIEEFRKASKNTERWIDIIIENKTK